MKATCRWFARQKRSATRLDVYKRQVDEMLHHVKAVRRGTKDALLIADMPYGSYQADPNEAIHNATRFVKEGGAEAVKMEGGEKRRCV